MVKAKIIPPEALDHLAEDIGLETILEMNDIEPQTVIELLISHGLINLEDFEYEVDEDDY